MGIVLDAVNALRRVKNIEAHQLVGEGEVDNPAVPDHIAVSLREGPKGRDFLLEISALAKKQGLYPGRIREDRDGGYALSLGLTSEEGKLLAEGILAMVEQTSRVSELIKQTPRILRNRRTPPADSGPAR
ncbi:MAG: hypothetical protein KGJ06_01720 [Pseudomonadota bacterium]|nr:hypothetical protein [Pseudomonadota bacterium]